MVCLHLPSSVKVNRDPPAWAPTSPARGKLCRDADARVSPDMGVCERGASGGEDPGEVGAVRRCLSLLHCLPPAQPWPLSWSRFRLLCHRIITHKMFDHVVLVIIFLNCITIAMERPKIDPHSAVSPWDYTQWLLSACSVPGPSWVSKQGGRGGPERHRGREPGLPLRSP